jgi:hypothetical protein
MMKISLVLICIAIVLFYAWSYKFFKKGFPKLSKNKWRLAYLFSPLLFSAYGLCWLAEIIYAKFNVGVYCEVTYQPDLPPKMKFKDLSQIDSNDIAAYSLSKDGSLKQISMAEFEEMIKEELGKIEETSVTPTGDKKILH